LRRPGWVRLAITLATAGAARRAAAASPGWGDKEAVCALADAARAGTGGAVRMDTTAGPALPVARDPSQCGLSVPTTNRTARATVTAWENRSQSLRMERDKERRDGCS
jgi:hypothetical protein